MNHGVNPIILYDDIIKPIGLTPGSILSVLEFERAALLKQTALKSNFSDSKNIFVFFQEGFFFGQGKVQILVVGGRQDILHPLLGLAFLTLSLTGDCFTACSRH